MTQIKYGNQAEEYVANHFKKKGQWATIIPKKVDGSQPFDIIAHTKCNTYFIDVKHCARDYYPFSRIEENQVLSMNGILKQKNKQAIVGFAMVYKDTIYFMHFKDYLEYKEKGFKSIKPTSCGLL